MQRCAINIYNYRMPISLNGDGVSEYDVRYIDLTTGRTVEKRLMEREMPDFYKEQREGKVSVISIHKVGGGNMSWTEWKASLLVHLKKVIDILEKAGVPREEAVDEYQDLKDTVAVILDGIEETIEELVPPEEEDELEDGW